MKQHTGRVIPDRLQHLLHGRKSLKSPCRSLIFAKISHFLLLFPRSSRQNRNPISQYSTISTMVLKNRRNKHKIFLGMQFPRPLPPNDIQILSLSTVIHSYLPQPPFRGLLRLHIKDMKRQQKLDQGLWNPGRLRGRGNRT